MAKDYDIDFHTIGNNYIYIYDVYLGLKIRGDGEDVVFTGVGKHLTKSCAGGII